MNIYDRISEEENLIKFIESEILKKEKISKKLKKDNSKNAYKVIPFATIITFILSIVMYLILSSSLVGNIVIFLIFPILGAIGIDIMRFSEYSKSKQKEKQNTLEIKKLKSKLAKEEKMLYMFKLAVTNEITKIKNKKDKLLLYKELIEKMGIRPVSVKLGKSLDFEQYFENKEKNIKRR